MDSSDQLSMGVGGWVLGACRDGIAQPLAVEPHFHPFLTRSRPDLELTYARGRVDGRGSRLIFDSGGVWRLHRQLDGCLRYDLSDPVLGPEPYAQALVEPDLSRGRVCLRTLEGHRANGLLYPFVYPLDEVLFISLIARRGGLHVHAAGIDDRGSGLLFPGVSGAGKSTISKLWLQQPGVRVLSDDRNVLRIQRGVVRIHGTPWHGEAELSCAGTVPLKAICFLEQATENRVLPLSVADASAELIARSFPAYWDAAGLARALETAARITAEVACYRLRFRPDAGAVDAVREEISRC